MKKVKIEDLDCFISDGNYSSKYPKSTEFLKEGIPFIRCNNFKNNSIVKEDMYYISEKKHAELLKGHLKTGDVLITTRGSLGQVAIVPKEFDDANINAQIVLLRPNPNKIFNKYLMWCLKSKNVQKQILQNKTGTALQQLPVGKLKKIEICICEDLEKQEEIVRKLDNIERIINLKQWQLYSINELIKSQFVEMFGDPILNPMKWEVKKLKDISNKIMSGNTPKGGDRVYVSSGIEFYRSQNVWKNRIEKDDIAYIDEETHKNMLKSSLKHNDLLITKTGRINTENSSLGRTAIYTGEDDKANINGHIYLVRLNEGENHEFVLRILISDRYREHIRKVCVGGIDKRQLNKEHIEDFPIIYPPKRMQKEFTDKVKQIDKQKFEIQKSLEETQKLKESLMNKYFGG